MYKKIFFFIFFSWLAAWPALAFTPQDPFYSDQYYLKNMGLNSVWDISRGQGIIVAVLDTGVDINHPDLQDNIWTNSGEIAGDGLDNDHNGYIDDAHGWDFIVDSSDPMPKFGTSSSVLGMSHGTAIAGTIAAEANNIGLIGVAPETKIMPLRVLDSTGVGDTAGVIKAIRYAVNNGADIINLSLVGDEPDDNLLSAIKSAEKAGVMVIVAAGNSNRDLDVISAYPSCYSHDSGVGPLLSVTSVNSSDQKSSFSSYGVKCVDLSAYGESVAAPLFYNPNYPDFKEYYLENWNGTSFSAALASGAAALVKSSNRHLSPQEIFSLLFNNSRPVDKLNPDYAGKLGRGILDLSNFAPSATSTQAIGYLIKTSAKNPLYYYVDGSGSSHAFADSQVLKSWYQNSLASVKIKTVSTAALKKITPAPAVAIRPGNLVRFSGKKQIYVVAPTNRLCLITSNSVGEYLYGSSWQRQALSLPLSYFGNYQRDGGCDLDINSSYPDGSLIQYSGSRNIWYIDNGQKRKVSPEAFLANGFSRSRLILGVNNNIFYDTGRPLNAWEATVFPYKLKS
ncbi:MAG: S8 family serine peptidase [Patescibacteria group bacterium]